MHLFHEWIVLQNTDLPYEGILGCHEKTCLCGLQPGKTQTG